MQYLCCTHTQPPAAITSISAHFKEEMISNMKHSIALMCDLPLLIAKNPVSQSASRSFDQSSSHYLRRDDTASLSFIWLKVSAQSGLKILSLQIVIKILINIKILFACMCAVGP